MLSYYLILDLLDLLNELYHLFMLLILKKIPEIRLFILIAIEVLVRTRCLFESWQLNLMVTFIWFQEKAW